MSDILIPFSIEDLPTKPEMAARIRLSDDMQQTLASLVGFDNIARRLLRCTMGGVLYTTTPRLENIIHITGSGANDDYAGTDIKVTEVMIMGHPDNSSLIWVKNDEAATINNGWPLAAKAVVNVTIDNLLNLNLLIVGDGEKAIIAYTR